MSGYADLKVGGEISTKNFHRIAYMARQAGSPCLKIEDIKGEEPFFIEFEDVDEEILDQILSYLKANLIEFDSWRTDPEDGLGGIATKYRHGMTHPLEYDTDDNSEPHISMLTVQNALKDALEGEQTLEDFADILMVHMEPVYVVDLKPCTVNPALPDTDIWEGDEDEGSYEE